MDKLDFSMQVLSKAMNLRMKRHAMIAGNLANADTPGYRPKDISFESKLQNAVKANNPSMIYQVSGKTEFVDDKVPRKDGNTVSTDKQLAKLTENTMVYTASAEFLKKKIGMLKRVITGN